jgi:hypothetical protein
VESECDEFPDVINNRPQQVGTRNAQDNKPRTKSEARERRREQGAEVSGEGYTPMQAAGEALTPESQFATPESARSSLAALNVSIVPGGNAVVSGENAAQIVSAAFPGVRLARNAAGGYVVGKTRSAEVADAISRAKAAIGRQITEDRRQSAARGAALCSVVSILTDGASSDD